jgi:hypothetical protein
MTDRITIRPGNLTTALLLRSSTCLALCTDIDSDSTGHVNVVRKWPSLSSGEEVVWSVLAYLNGQGNLPTRETLAAELDTRNYASVLAVLTDEGLVA